jgi:hypothetical protein
MLPRFDAAMFVALPRKVDTMLPRFDAGHEHGKQTNEFAAREQPRAIDTQFCTGRLTCWLLWT